MAGAVIIVSKSNCVPREYLELVHHMCFGAVEMDTPLNRRDVYHDLLLTNLVRISFIILRSTHTWTTNFLIHQFCGMASFFSPRYIVCPLIRVRKNQSIHLQNVWVSLSSLLLFIYYSYYSLSSLSSFSSASNEYWELSYGCGGCCLCIYKNKKYFPIE